MSKNIGYHTRLYSNNSTKVCGGSFGGSLDIETANRLANSQFSVVVKPSGTPVFVDREGREVRLYISVDPEMTVKGAEAIHEWRVARAKQQDEDDRTQQEQEQEVESLMEGLSHEEIVRRLTKDEK